MPIIVYHDCDDMKADFEKILARYVAKIVPDLRLVELCHYVCDLTHGRYANIADIIEQAVELYFFPRTFRFAQRGDFHLGWGREPIILLDMEFFNQGVRSLFCLQLQEDSFGIELERIRFGNAYEVDFASAHSDQHRLLSALNDACLRKLL